MADYRKRLNNLRDRRLGLDRSMNLFTKAFESASTRDSVAFKEEAYERRTEKDVLKYVLGAMQQVDDDFTRISFEEGDRVKNHLDKALNGFSISASFEYQGSVPLNIHIRGYSDIDLLVIAADFLTFDPSGPRAGDYVYLGGSSVDGVQKLRRDCAQGLEGKFPAADLKTDGSKSITLSGGSLRRKVDVVPAVWHDTARYQASRAKRDREIRILDRSIPLLLSNRPFLHMAAIEDFDRVTSAGAKKVIRLLKNVKGDSDDQIDLSSYDIASLVWNMDAAQLSRPNYLEASLLLTARSHLNYWANNRSVSSGNPPAFSCREKWS